MSKESLEARASCAFAHIYARLKTLAAIKAPGFIWNSTPWLTKLSPCHVQTIAERMRRDSELQHTDLNVDGQGIMHLGRTLGLDVDIFIWFPKVEGMELERSIRCPNHGFVRLWTDDIVIPALRELVPPNGSPHTWQSFWRILECSRSSDKRTRSGQDGMPVFHELLKTGVQLGRFWSTIEENLRRHPQLRQLGRLVLFAFQASDQLQHGGNGWDGDCRSTFSSLDEVWKHNVQMWEEFMDPNYIIMDTFHVEAQVNFESTVPESMATRDDESGTRSLVVRKRSRVPSLSSSVTSRVAPETKRSKFHSVDEDVVMM